MPLSPLEHVLLYHVFRAPPPDQPETLKVLQYMLKYHYRKAGSVQAVIEGEDAEELGQRMVKELAGG